MFARLLTGVVVVGAAFAPPARADDDVAVKAAYQQAAAHVKAERWSTAVDSLRRLMADHPGSSAVLERLGAIEADLRRSMFRAQAKHPSADTLFGKAAQGFVVSERRLTLEYPAGPVGADWTVRGGFYVHRVPFDSDVALEFLAPTIASATKEVVRVELSGVNPLDPAAPSGTYRITPGACTEDWKYKYSKPGSILRFDPGTAAKQGPRELVTKPTPGKVELDQMQTYRVVRRGTGINVSVDGKPFLICQDGKYPITRVSVSAARIGNTSIRGVVEKTYYLDLLEKRFAVEQSAWEREGYVRSEALPKWVLDAAPNAPAPPAPAK